MGPPCGRPVWQVAFEHARGLSPGAPVYRGSGPYSYASASAGSIRNGKSILVMSCFPSCLNTAAPFLTRCLMGFHLTLDSLGLKEPTRANGVEECEPGLPIPRSYIDDSECYDGTRRSC